MVIIMNKEEIVVEIKEYKKIVAEFINDMNKKNSNDTTKYYLHRDSYQFLKYFNFDFLNYNSNIIDEEVAAFFENKTTLKNGREKLKVLQEKRSIYQNSLDPDNMSIVRLILMIIYEDKLQEIYFKFQNENMHYLDELKKIEKMTKRKKEQINETIMIFNRLDNVYMLRPDTMNSYKWIYGKKFTDVYSDDYIKASKNPSKCDKKAIDFYYDYHKIGNFMLLPNETIIPILERYVNWANAVSQFEGIVYLQKSDSINTYRGLHGLGIPTEFGNDDFYQFIELLKNITITKDENIRLLIKRNDYFFSAFEKEELLKMLVIEPDYTSNLYEERNSTLLRAGKDKKEVYSDCATEIINKRSDLLIDRLCEKMKEIN